MLSVLMACEVGAILYEWSGLGLTLLLTNTLLLYFPYVKVGSLCKSNGRMMRVCWRRHYCMKEMGEMGWNWSWGARLRILGDMVWVKGWDSDSNHKLFSCVNLDYEKINLSENENGSIIACDAGTSRFWECTFSLATTPNVHLFCH